MRAMVLGIFCSVVVVSAGAFAADGGRKVDDKTFFRRQVRPILSENCFECHGPGVQKSNLRLDQREAALSAGVLIPVIVPGHPEKSALIDRITSDDIFTRMPPADVDEKLTEEQIAILTEWVKRGAPYAVHWAYERDSSIIPPTPRYADWCRNEIDAFILKRLEEAGLEPSPVADRNTLIRRVSLDLTGILPTPEQVKIFVNDPRPDAYERLVDRLLASPHYGQRQARHWLDIARYADSNGYTVDSARTMWPYRDWVIEAMNANMPFDQFTIEQLAGDLLENPTKSQLIATGFQRNTPFNQEGGADPEQFRVERTIDRTNTIGAAWLGLTVRCAQCHDHKFDAISQEDYYGLYAFFNSVKEANLAVPKANRAERIAPLLAKIEATKSDSPLWLREEFGQKFASNPGRYLADGWTVLEPTKTSAQNNTKLTVLDDGSILAAGEVPETDVYQIEVTLPAGKMTAIRLEALTHSSLPNNGPGRAGNGNFVLSDFTVEIDGKPVKLAKALADHSQKDYDVSEALKGDRNQGWAINTGGGKMNVNRTAVFLPDEPVALEKSTAATIRLVFAKTPAQYTLGRFRLATTGASPKIVGLPVPVQSQLLSLTKIHDPDKLKSTLTAAAAAWRTEKIEELRNKIAEIQKETINTLILSKRKEPRPTHILVRGNFLDPGKSVKPDTFASLPDLEYDGKRATRLDLARWLVRDDHPLTPRVVVNRYWQRFFGKGIVATQNDFGTQGAFPTHPKLLDWLAAEFVASDWNVKHMHKLIVTSATYRQSSVWRDDAFEVDPRNKLLALQNRLRLDAEILRDVALRASGELVEEMGGPGIHPPQPDEVFSFTQSQRKWVADTDGDRYRRGVYIFIWRQSQHPLLATFDGPDAQTSCTRRNRSDTPLQSLHLANNKAFFELAQALGQRVQAATLTSASERIDYAFKLCMSREPTAAERDVLLSLLKQQKASHPETAWTMVARTIMNLDEFITRE